MADTSSIDIAYVANLARLDLTEDEKKKFSVQLGEVLKYFERINEVDVTDVEPMAHAFPVYNIWDEDKAEEGFTVEEALKNAPARREDQIVVPKVVE